MNERQKNCRFVLLNFVNNKCKLPVIMLFFYVSFLRIVTSIAKVTVLECMNMCFMVKQYVICWFRHHNLEM